MTPSSLKQGIAVDSVTRGTYWQFICSTIRGRSDLINYHVDLGWALFGEQVQSTSLWNMKKQEREILNTNFVVSRDLYCATGHPVHNVTVWVSKHPQ